MVRPPDLSVDVYPVTPAASLISGGGTTEIEEHFGALDESAHSRCFLSNTTGRVCSALDRFYRAPGSFNAVSTP